MPILAGLAAGGWQACKAQQSKRRLRGPAKCKRTVMLLSSSSVKMRPASVACAVSSRPVVQRSTVVYFAVEAINDPSPATGMISRVSYGLRGDSSGLGQKVRGYPRARLSRDAWLQQSSWSRCSTALVADFLQRRLTRLGENAGGRPKCQVTGLCSLRSWESRGASAAGFRRGMHPGAWQPVSTRPAYAGAGANAD